MVITGASRGIGLALTALAAESGDRIIAAVRAPKHALALKELAERLPIRILPLDVSDAGSVACFCRDLGDTPVDVLVNNAGVMGGDRQSASDMDYDAWRHAFEVNTIAPFRLTMALLPNLRRAAAPKVITLTSQMGALSRTSRAHTRIGAPRRQQTR